ncbi:dual specificity protein kinase zak2-like [Argonauta hians]
MESKFWKTVKKIQLATGVHPYRHLDVENLTLPILEHDFYYVSQADGQKQLVGKGTYGRVYLGRCKGMPNLVAVKCFKNKNMKEIYTEARIMRHLSDTGVVPMCLGLIQDANSEIQPCLVQEYFGQGITLSKFLCDLRVNLKTKSCLGICLQLSRGLRKIHTHGILLNDIKADNILIDRYSIDLQIRYIDFGCASTLRGILFDITASESCYHVAPEVKAKQLTTTSSDIFSLGHVFDAIHDLMRVECLRPVVNSCTMTNPKKRIKLQDLVEDLKSLHHEIFYREMRSRD